MIHVEKNNDFWKNQMLPYLTRFYSECMLPEILDSRYNRHMPIRNPKYICDAQEKVRMRTNRQENKEINEEIQNNCKMYKGRKRDISFRKVAVTNDTETQSTDKDDDCVFVSYTKRADLTKKELAKRKKILDNMIAPLFIVKKNVMSNNNKLNDESLDSFLHVIRETTCFETQSVLYIEYPEEIDASQSDKSLQIIGGNCTDHWRCLFFDGSLPHVYDSLPGCTYEKLAYKEKEYIHRRYLGIKQNDIIFEKVIKQPNSTCCGIYAAAFTTSIVLGRTYARKNIPLIRKVCDTIL